MKLPAHHPVSPITADDLQHFGTLVPPTGLNLLRILGQRDGLALLNGLSGVQIMVPKGPCNNPSGARVWAYITRVIGEGAMNTLAQHMGGQYMDVPTLDDLRKERRNHAIRTQFDYLTARVPGGEGLSKARAVQELVLMHAPITWRQIETILDRPAVMPTTQNLF